MVSARHHPAATPLLALPPSISPQTVQELSRLAELMFGPTRPVAYDDALRCAWFLAIAINRLPLQSMLAAIEREDSIGPLLHPSAWLGNHGRMSEDRSVVAALLQTQSAVAKDAAGRPEFAIWPPRHWLLEEGR